MARRPLGPIGGFVALKRYSKVSAVIAIFIALAYACHTYRVRQAYKTGVYMGKTSFTAAEFRNHRCLSLHANSSQRSFEITDLGKDSVVEDALASAHIIPSFSDSEVAAIHTGFRVGWREARMAAFH